MRANDKIVYGYITLSIAFIAFIVAVLLGSFETGLIFLLIGIIGWLGLSHIGGIEGVEGHIGTVLLISGFIIGGAALLGFGLQKNILGEYKFNTAGIIIALCLWLLIGGLGLLYRGLHWLNKKLHYLQAELKKLYKAGS